MLGFKLAHVGINTENAEEAKKAADMFTAMFGFAAKEGETNYFMGSNEVEIMKTPFLGRLGHIAISTNTLPRAVAYFKSRGFKFREETVTDKIAYFEDEIAGFAVHLTQR